MNNPGLLILAACVAVLVQAGLCVWCCRWSSRALERRMDKRMDELAAIVQQQIDRETALIRLVQETLTEARLALHRIDEQDLARVKSELE